MSNVTTYPPFQAILQIDFARNSGLRGWLKPSFLREQKSVLLEEGLHSYGLFLKLVLVPGMPEVYPTPVVDLVWHTHQLLGYRYMYVLKLAVYLTSVIRYTQISCVICYYRSQSLDMVGVFVDHLSMEQIAPTESNSFTEIYYYHQLLLMKILRSCL